MAEFRVEWLTYAHSRARPVPSLTSPGYGLPLGVYARRPINTKRPSCLEPRTFHNRGVCSHHTESIALPTELRDRHDRQLVWYIWFFFAPGAVIWINSAWLKQSWIGIGINSTSLVTIVESESESIPLVLKRNGNRFQLGGIEHKSALRALRLRIVTKNLLRGIGRPKMMSQWRHVLQVSMGKRFCRMHCTA